MQPIAQTANITAVQIMQIRRVTRATTLSSLSHVVLRHHLHVAPFDHYRFRIKTIHVNSLSILVESHNSNYCMRSSNLIRRDKN